MSLIKLRDGRILDMDSAEYHAYVHAEEAKAPPLSLELKAKLRVLLAPMREALRERAEARLAAEGGAPRGSST